MHARKKLTGAGKPRHAKMQKSKRGRRAVCSCVSHYGEPKVLFSEHSQASRRAGEMMGPEGKMWQVYRCPEVEGWHISTVRWDPWELTRGAVESRLRT